MPEHTFRKTEAGRYILQTGLSPAGCNNLLFVVWRGAIGNLQEEVITARELCTTQAVAPAKVPVDWYNALARASGLFLEREPPPPYQELPAEPSAQPYSAGDYADDLTPPQPSMFGWAPYWALFIIVIILSFVLGAS